MAGLQHVPLISSIVAVMAMTVPIIHGAVPVVATVMVVAVVGKIPCSIEGHRGGGRGRGSLS